MPGRVRGVGRAIGIAAGAVAVGAAAAVGGGVYLARRAVTPSHRADEPVAVVDVRAEGEETIVRLRGDGAALPGRYSFFFDAGAGAARLGEVRRMVGRAAERPLVRVDRGDLVPGARGRIAGWWYADPEELGFRTERITYPTDLGDADAWIVHPRRARKRRWAVHVHGRGALPEEVIRGVAPLARAGVTSLIISYRNDPGAPSGDYGRYGIGLAESRDVDAAIVEAQRRGAERVTLVGWSMGGTACLISATRGRRRHVVDGLILDSPAVDWAALLRYHASGLSVPRGIADVGIHLLGRGIVRGGEPGGISFDDLTPEAFARELSVHVLIHASTADTYVPCAGAEALAAARPELVELRLVDIGEHVKLWNVDPEAWERTTERFARALPRPAWRGWAGDHG